jgi:hypothetical protein
VTQSTLRVFRTLCRVLATAGLVTLTGCFAMVAGVHQDVHFKSELPDVAVNMDGKMCAIPCTMRIRRQWGTFQMHASRNGEIVAAGPISRIEEYAKRDCDSTHENYGLMLLAAITDGLLIIPGIVDISTGIVVWHPDTVVINSATYQLEDPCLAQPVVLTSQPSP